jgi:hypothetical protein
MIDYKIVNISDGPVGPLNLLTIFGSLCDAQPQEVTLQAGEEMEFCGQGEDIADIQDRLAAELAGLGITERVIDIYHSFHVVESTIPEPESPGFDPDGAEPPTEV